MLKRASSSKRDGWRRRWRREGESAGTAAAATTTAAMVVTRAAAARRAFGEEGILVAATAAFHERRTARRASSWACDFECVKRRFAVARIASCQLTKAGSVRQAWLFIAQWSHFICRGREGSRQVCACVAFRRRTHRQHHKKFWRTAKHSIYSIRLLLFNNLHLATHQSAERWKLKKMKKAKRESQRHFLHRGDGKFEKFASHQHLFSFWG